MDAALERVAEQGLTREVGGGVSARIDDNMIVITDSRDVPIPGIDPIPMTSNLAQTATQAIFEDEGYSASGTLVNVPSSTNSGVTIGGLDLGNKAGDIDRKLEILSAYIPEPQIEALRDISGLTGTEASNALANAISDGRIKPDSWGLTDNSFKDMQARYLDERIIPDVVEKVSKFSPRLIRRILRSCHHRLFRPLPQWSLLPLGLDVNPALLRQWVRPLSLDVEKIGLQPLDHTTCTMAHCRCSRTVLTQEGYFQATLRGLKEPQSL